MTKAEEEALAALASMAAQCLDAGDGELKHRFMSAGERAVAVLAAQGLVEARPGGGRWTQAGLDFLGSH